MTTFMKPSSVSAAAILAASATDGAQTPLTTFTDGGISDPLRLLSAADRALTNDAAVTWLILLLSQQQAA